MTRSEKLEKALRLMVREYNPFDNLMANGCIHGIKPSKDCPNEGCEDAELQRALEEAGALVWLVKR